ncbi:MAG: urease subunit alpha, partial [Thermomicrobiales bacterium]
MPVIPRSQYVDLYGPTVGDKIRLADTNLYAEIEKDYTVYGDELVYGGGKTARDGMGLMPGATNSQGALDLVITNVVIIDAIQGIIKADIGIRDGKIAGIGKAGNPFMMAGVHPNMLVSAGTEVISGEGQIATAGGIDSHIHMISPQQAFEALSNGITTHIGGGVGPTDGTNGTTCTPGPWNIHRMLAAYEGLPINVGLLGKGNSSLPHVLVDQVLAGACGLKVHEDWGSTPAVIDCALSVADEFDVQVAIHTDSLNESGFVDDTISIINGRTLHTYHTEGAGGGHAPDVIKVAGLPNVLPSSTNPTLPYTINSIAELLDMVMVCHHLNPKVPEDVAFAESRVRAETISAETVLHDMGVISAVSSDSQAMGRCGENITRAFQMAHLGKERRGQLPEDAPGNDNFRIKRYIAKVTINPATMHGVSHAIGSIEVGKMADIVLWPTWSFAAKPRLIVKGGLVSWAQMGDPNASLPTPQPVYYRPMYGAFGLANQLGRVNFMSQAAIDRGVSEELGLRSPAVAVKRCRDMTKYDLPYNDQTPEIEVD